MLNKGLVLFLHQLKAKRQENGTVKSGPHLYLELGLCTPVIPNWHGEKWMPQSTLHFVLW